MSQNSLVLPTSGTLSGLAAVEAINAAVDTLNTLASGASPPSSPEAGQFWHDTTNKVLKIRSIDNTTWIAIGTLDETNYQFNATSRPTPTIYGLTLSNDASTPNTLLDIAPGGASDSTAFQYMRLATAMTKNATAAWAAGTGNGSLDTGSLQASKFYHVHLILNPTTAAVDVLTSLSYSNPDLPTGYTNFIQIGAFFSNASSNVTPFVQDGNEFLYTTAFSDATTVEPTNSLQSLTVPSGLKLKALFRCTISSNYSGGTPSIILQSPDENTEVVSPQNSSLFSIYDSYSSGDFEIRTNANAQIRVSTSIVTTQCSYWISTKGFIYPRGLR